MAQLTASICNADNRLLINSRSQDRGFMSLFAHGSRRDSLLVGLLTMSSLTATLGAHAKQTQPTPPIYGGNPRSQESGSATGGVFAPVLDSEKRPITAGGFVKTGPIVYQDASKKSGLTVWRHRMGNPEKNYILETTGSGVALLDYDHDGWIDIYLVNGSTY